jgi:hypothetical protein
MDFDAFVHPFITEKLSFKAASLFPSPGIIRD